MDVSEDPAISSSFQHKEMASLDNPSARGLAMDLVASSFLLLLRLPAGYANSQERLAAHTRHFWLFLPPPSLHTQMPNSPTLGAKKSEGA